MANVFLQNPILQVHTEIWGLCLFPTQIQYDVNDGNPVAAYESDAAEATAAGAMTVVQPDGILPLISI